LKEYKWNADLVNAESKGISEFLKEEINTSGRESGKRKKATLPAPTWEEKLCFQGRTAT